MEESSLHDDGPDIHSDVQDDDGVETGLGAAALAEVLHVEDVPETKAADAGRTSQTVWCGEGCNGCTYMQKKGEMRDESARARTEKWMAKYVDQVPLQDELIS